MVVRSSRDLFLRSKVRPLHPFVRLESCFAAQARVVRSFSSSSPSSFAPRRDSNLRRPNCRRSLPFLASSVHVSFRQSFLFLLLPLSTLLVRHARTEDADSTAMSRCAGPRHRFDVVPSTFRFGSNGKLERRRSLFEPSRIGKRWQNCHVAKRTA